MASQSYDFLTFPEVQGLLKVKSRKTLLKYIQDGKLKAYKLAGTRWRVRKSDIDVFLKLHRSATQKLK